MADGIRGAKLAITPNCGISRRSSKRKATSDALTEWLRI